MISTLCITAILVFALDAQIFPSVLTELSDNSYKQGMILSFMYFLFPITSGYSGFLSEKVGKPLILSIGSVLMALPFLLGSYFTDINSRILFALLFGIGGGIIEGQGSALLSDLHKDKERSILNISQSFYCLGAASGPLLISLYFRYNTSPALSTILLLFGSLTLGLAPFFLWAYFALHKKSSVLKKNIRNRGKVLFLKDKAFIYLCVAIFLYVAAEGGTIGWLSTYGVIHLSLNLSQAPLLLTVLWTGLGISRSIVGFINIPISDGNLLVLSGLSMIFFQIAAFLFTNLLLVGIMIFCLGLSMGSVWPTLVSIAGRIYKHRSGVAIGIMVGSGALALPIIQPIISILSSIPSFQLRGALMSLSILGVISLFLYKRIVKHETYIYG